MFVKTKPFLTWQHRLLRLQFPEMECSISTIFTVVQRKRKGWALLLFLICPLTKRNGTSRKIAKVHLFDNFSSPLENDPRPGPFIPGELPPLLLCNLDWCSGPALHHCRTCPSPLGEGNDAPNHVNTDGFTHLKTQRWRGLLSATFWFISQTNTSYILFCVRVCCWQTSLL